MLSAEQRVSLKISHWAAWSGGVATREKWIALFEGAAVADPDASPSLEFLPALQRRRFSRLSRMALNVAHQSLVAIPGSPHLVFSSRYGEYAVTYHLLSALAKGEPLSPAAFSMSVHNTGAGVCTMVQGLTGHSGAIAAGPDSLEMAVLDCWMLLASNETDDVLMVFADQPLPLAYQQDDSVPTGGFALALRLALPRAGGQPKETLSLGWMAGKACQDCATMGGGIRNLLQLLLGYSRGYRRPCGRLEWSWKYHAAA